MEDQNKQNDRLLEKIILIFMLIVSFLLCFFQYFDHDEFEAVHTIWKIIHGQIIFVDFFQQKPPFYHITFIPIFKIFSETIKTLFICKFYVYILFLILIWATTIISTKVFGDKTKYLTPIILLSCTFFTDKLTEIRPDTMYIMLCMVSLMFLYKDEQIKKSSIILSGIFAGLAFAILPKAGFYVMLTSFILCFRFITKKLTFLDVSLYFIASFITIIPFFIYLFRTITLEDYYFFNFTMNFKFLDSFPPTTFIPLLIKQNAPFLILAILGLFNLKDSRQKEIGFVAIMLFLSVFSINVPNKQYFVPSMPFLAMIAANYISQKPFLNKYSFSVILIIIISPVLYFMDNIINQTHCSQIEKINYVLSITKPEDKIYDGDIRFNIYRDDIDYFWFSFRPNGVVDTYKYLKNTEYDIYKIIKKEKPKVLANMHINVENEFIKNNYRKSEVYDDLYIRRHNNEK